jgi:hypothetical protein
MKLLAIDPGGEHVGLAQFEVLDDLQVAVRGVWESPPDEAADVVAGMLLGNTLGVLVVEGFRLYGDKALAQVGSEMHTSELIGVLKYLVRSANYRNRREGTAEVVLALQPAHIQKPMAGQLRARGVKSKAAGLPHGKSAELHGWHYLGRNVLGWGEPLAG